MKKLHTTCLAVAMIAMTQGAYAQDSGPYIQGSLYGTDLMDTEVKYTGGFGKANYDSDIGLGAGGEFGYKFNPYLRTSIEAAYRNNQVKDGGGSGHYQSGAAMANGYLDIPTNTAITPYIGAGAGYAYVRLSDDVANGDSLHDSVFAYQFMAGLSFAASPKTDIVLGYKYFGTKTPEYDTVISGVQGEVPYKVSNVELGFRYKF